MLKTLHIHSKMGSCNNKIKNHNRKIRGNNFVEEALHRLVEIHYHLGLENEAKEYAKILGYNYNSSEWFQQSYKILNKNYVFKSNQNNNKNIKKEKIYSKNY